MTLGKSLSPSDGRGGSRWVLICGFLLRITQICGPLWNWQHLIWGFRRGLKTPCLEALQLFSSDLCENCSCQVDLRAKCKELLLKGKIPVYENRVFWTSDYKNTKILISRMYMTLSNTKISNSYCTHWDKDIIQEILEQEWVYSLLNCFIWCYNKIKLFQNSISIVSGSHKIKKTSLSGKVWPYWCLCSTT